MAKYTPETGYPTVSLDGGKMFNDDDILEFKGGLTATGAQYNQMLDNYRNSERGKALLAHMRGEGPEPEPLMTLEEIETEDGRSRRAFLGRSDVDITDIDPDVGVPLDELFPKDED